jgi:hypothetical protein
VNRKLLISIYYRKVPWVNIRSRGGLYHLITPVDSVFEVLVIFLFYIWAVSVYHKVQDTSELFSPWSYVIMCFFNSFVALCILFFLAGCTIVHIQSVWAFLILDLFEKPYPPLRKLYSPLTSLFNLLRSYLALFNTHVIRFRYYPFSEFCFPFYIILYFPYFCLLFSIFFLQMQAADTGTLGGGGGV